MTESELKKIPEILAKEENKKNKNNNQLTFITGELNRIGEDCYRGKALKKAKESLENKIAKNELAITLCKELIALNTINEKLNGTDPVSKDDLNDVINRNSLLFQGLIKSQDDRYDADIAELIKIDSSDDAAYKNAMKKHLNDYRFKTGKRKTFTDYQKNSILADLDHVLNLNIAERNTKIAEKITAKKDFGKEPVNELTKYDMAELKKCSTFGKAKETVTKKVKKLSEEAKKKGTKHKDTLKGAACAAGVAFIAAIVALATYAGCHGKDKGKSNNNNGGRINPTETVEPITTIEPIETPYLTEEPVLTDKPTAEPTIAPTAEQTVAPTERALIQLEEDLRKEYYDEETIQSTVNRVFEAYMLYKQAGYDISIEDVAYLAKVALVDTRTDERAMLIFASSGYATDMMAHNGNNPEKVDYMAEARAINVAQSKNLNDYLDEIRKLINQKLTGSISSDEYNNAVQGIVEDMMDDTELTQSDRATAELWFNSMGIGDEKTFTAFRKLATIKPDKCAELDGMSLKLTNKA